jgi:hypothetical protein
MPIRLDPPVESQIRQRYSSQLLTTKQQLERAEADLATTEQVVRSAFVPLRAPFDPQERQAREAAEKERQAVKAEYARYYEAWESRSREAQETAKRSLDSATAREALARRQMFELHFQLAKICRAERSFDSIRFGAYARRLATGG